MTVIVDRLRVEPEAHARIVEAVETAFREGDGAALAIEVDETGLAGRVQVRRRLNVATAA